MPKHAKQEKPVKYTNEHQREIIKAFASEHKNELSTIEVSTARLNAIAKAYQSASKLVSASIQSSDKDTVPHDIMNILMEMFTHYIDFVDTFTTILDAYTSFDNAFLRHEIISGLIAAGDTTIVGFRQTMLQECQKTQALYFQLTKKLVGVVWHIHSYSNDIFGAPASRDVFAWGWAKTFSEYWGPDSAKGKIIDVTKRLRTLYDELSKLTEFYNALITKAWGEHVTEYFESTGVFTHIAEKLEVSSSEIKNPNDVYLLAVELETIINLYLRHKLLGEGKKAVDGSVQTAFEELCHGMVDFEKLGDELVELRFCNFDSDGTVTNKSLQETLHNLAFAKHVFASTHTYQLYDDAFYYLESAATDLDSFWDKRGHNDPIRKLIQCCYMVYEDLQEEEVDESLLPDLIQLLDRAAQALDMKLARNESINWRFLHPKGAFASLILSTYGYDYKTKRLQRLSFHESNKHGMPIEVFFIEFMMTYAELYKMKMEPQYVLYSERKEVHAQRLLLKKLYLMRDATDEAIKAFVEDMVENHKYLIATDSIDENVSYRTTIDAWIERTLLRLNGMKVFIEDWPYQCKWQEAKFAFYHRYVAGNYKSLADEFDTAPSVEEVTEAAQQLSVS